MLFKLIAWGMLTIVGVAVIRHFNQIEQKRRASAAEIERRRAEWMRKIEQARLNGRSPIASERAQRAGFRVIE